MARAVKAPRKAAKKATKRGASGADDARAQHAAERAHVAGRLHTAHRAVLSIVHKVTADDAEGIAKLRRAVEHAHDNATARTTRGGRS